MTGLQVRGMEVRRTPTSGQKKTEMSVPHFSMLFMPFNINRTTAPLLLNYEGQMRNG